MRPMPAGVDRDEASEARRKVAQVLAMFRRNLAGWVDAEQLAVEASLALWWAEATWDPARGASFPVHAANCASWWLKRALGEQYPWGRKAYVRRRDLPVALPVSLDAPQEGERGEGGLTLADAQVGEAGAETIWEEAERRRAGEAFLAELAEVPATTRERQAALLLAAGLGIREAGERLGCSGEAARQSAKRFHRRAREHFRGTEPP